MNEPKPNGADKSSVPGGEQTRAATPEEELAFYRELAGSLEMQRNRTMNELAEAQTMIRMLQKNLADLSKAQPAPKPAAPDGPGAATAETN